jgi:hypothetical protein
MFKVGWNIISRDFTHNQLLSTFHDTILEWVLFGNGSSQSALPAEFSMSASYNQRSCCNKFNSKESQLEMK